MQKFEVRDKSINSLLTAIKDKQILMPEIQRPFVWDSTKVRDLIDSIYKGYPIGYIITSQNPDVKTKNGEVSRGKTLIIDGQQRLTALRAAVLGEPVVNKHYKKVHIKIAFHPIEEKFETQTPAIVKNSIWISDISKILDPNFDSYSFITNYVNQNPEVESAFIAKQIQNLRDALTNHAIGYIELSHDLDVETVAQIFLRINNTGVPLNQADFAMSKIAAQEDYDGSNIRKLVDYFAHLSVEPGFYSDIANNDEEFAKTIFLQKISWLKNEKGDLYDPDYSDILRVAFSSEFKRGKLADLVSLLSGRNFEKRTYEEEIISDTFSRLEKSILEFVRESHFKDFLQIIESTGFIDKSLISSKNAINFAYILYLIMKAQGEPIGVIQKTVAKWFVMSVITGRYSSSPESSFDSDIRNIEAHGAQKVLENIEAAELSDTFWDIGLVQDFDKSSITHPYINTFFAAQIHAGDKGFLSHSVTLRSIKSIKGDIHHIFPYNYLKKGGLTNRNEYNQIANFVYMERAVNIQVADRSPNDYMNIVIGQTNGDELKIGRIDDKAVLKSNLRQNCLPQGFENMTIADYPSFLVERRKLMANKIKDYYRSL